MSRAGAEWVGRERGDYERQQQAKGEPERTAESDDAILRELAGLPPLDKPDQ